MGFVTPKKNEGASKKRERENEGAYRKWERERRWLIRVFWFLVSLYIFVFAVCPLASPLLNPLVKWFFRTFIPTAPGAVPPIIAPMLEEPWWLPVIVIMGLLYAVILIVIRWGIIKRIIGRLSKGACIFAAIVTAEDLEKGNPVRASLFIDRLLLALNDFLGQKSVALGARYVAPLDLMRVTPETIPRRAVHRAIQASEDTKGFQESLRNLAIGLRDNADEGYLAAHQFLVWLDKNTESYHQVSRSFLDKRPALKTMLLNVFPIILPPLAGIIIAVLP